MLPIVNNDPWLNPVAQAVDDRYNRYEGRLHDIVNRFGSLKTFATAHQFLGFNYDPASSRLVVSRMGSSGALSLADGRFQRLEPL